jgi:hypothetical protein
MIEYDWKFTVDERDEEGDDDSDENVRWVQDALDDAGATVMCLDLIAKGMTTEVKDEAINLLMALLFQEGGNKKAQTTIHRHLNRPGQDSFFLEVIDTLTRITTFYTDGLSDGDPPGGKVLKVLQLACEGHFLQNQDIFREQPNNELSINLLKPFVALLKDLSRLRDSPPRSAIMGVLDLILEILQGPCQGNQNYLCHHTDMLETLNRMLREKIEDAADYQDATAEEMEEIEEETNEMKATVLKIFKAMLEGQGNVKPSSIYRRVLSVLHIEALQSLLNPPPLVLGSQDLEAQLEEKERLEQLPLTELQVQSLVLIKMLTGYNPDLSDELALSDSITKKLGTEVISVEVVWNGALEKIFFHVPDLTKHLAKSAMDDLVQSVDRESQEKKLTDFIVRTKHMLEGLEHQEMLAHYNLAKLFSRSNQYYVTWVTFMINLGINFIYLFNLSYISDDSNALTDDSGFQKYREMGLGASVTSPGTWRTAWRYDDDVPLNDYMAEMSGQTGMSHDFKAPRKCLMVSDHTKCYNLGDDDITTLLEALNLSQIIMSSFTLLLFLVVRSPISFKRTMKETGSIWQGFLAMFTQDLTLYYVGYLAFAILGYTVSPLYNTILLLDIVIKDSTARDVLNAVWVPINSLCVTVLLCLFVIYIFAFFVFSLNSMRADAEFLKGECDTLMKCWQWATGFGMRSGGGYADYLNGVSRYRFHFSYILDWLFFVIIIIIFMSIVFGIIIDQFGSLREEKKEREEDTTEICFVCGIGKQEFDQLGGRVWQQHIAHEHNMWAYLKFMVFLWQQDQDDDDGLEQYVRGCLENNDLRWFPHNKAIRLVDTDGRDESSGDALVDSMAAFRQKIHAELAKVQSHQTDQMKQIITEIDRVTQLHRDRPQMQKYSPKAGD